MRRKVNFLTRPRWGAAAGALLLSVLSPLGANAAFDATLQGLNAGETTWIAGNLMGWRELDYIPCRVYMTGGPANNKSITVEFDHMHGTIPGVENLTGWTPSPNVQIVSPPVLYAPIGAITWSYTFRVNVTDNNSGYVEFRARLSAGAHLNVGSSLALRGSPSLGSLQIHKPSPGAGYPDLAILKRGPINAAPGETIAYTITYTNKPTSPNSSIGVQVSDMLPAELEVVTNSVTSGGMIVGNSLIWDLGDLPIGATGTITYSAIVRPGTAYGTTFNNYAQILSSENDGNPGDNFSSVTTLVTFNRPPVANDDAYSVNEDDILNIPPPGVLANDTDADGNPLTVATPRPVSSPASGSLAFNANGSFRYTPNAGFSGIDTFTYQVTDGSATSAVAIVTITVNPLNDPPVAVNDSYATDEDTALSISAPGVLGNDLDPDGDTLIAMVLTGPAHGTVTLNSDGSFIYTPAPNYTGPDSFTYEASDGIVESAAATVSITVRPLNDPPLAGNDSYATDEDTALNVPAPGVLANDSDPDGDTLTAALLTAPAHGSIALNANGSFTYTPAANYAGPDSFTYRAGDGSAESAPATVSLTVRPINDLPVAVNDAYTTDEDTVLTISAPGVLSNDADADGDALTSTLVANPTHGTITLNPNGSFIYTPAANYNGPDSFTYRASDGTAQSSVATVSLTVRPINDPPVAMNDSYATDEDTTLTISAPGVLANDTDPEGSPLTATLVGAAAHGALSLNANGSFTYSPAANYNGPDSFSYLVSDGSAQSAPTTVNITVRPVNDPPVAANDNYNTDEDTPLNVPAPGVLANDTDADGNTLVSILVTGPAHGSVTLNANGSFIYTPVANYTGADAFTYKANDGAADSAVATVNITVRPVNDPPAAADDSYAIDEDTVLNIAAPGVLTNDTDVDGNPLTAALVSGPAHGAVTLNANGAFIYTPATNYSGPDSFTYRASDGMAQSAVATVTITVRPVNDPPVAANDAYATDEDTTLAISAPGVLANDTDADGNALTATLVANSSHGSVTLNANGSFAYTPAVNYTGPDTFTYKVSDGAAESGIATVSITVRPVNDPPAAVGDSYATDEDVTLTVSAPGVLGNDLDPDGDPLTAVRITGPLHGTVTLNSDGSFIYSPAPNYNGPDNFTYKVSDGSAESGPVTVNIIVRPVNDPPLAVNDSYMTDEDTLLTIAAPGVLGNDSDPDTNVLTASVVALPTHGTLTLSANGSFIYTPAANYNGTDSFTYKANDGTLDSAVATVVITIRPVNDPPLAVNDAYTTAEDTALNISVPGVLANDTDADGNLLTAALMNGPAHGTLSLNPDGSFSYTPAANYNGPDSFTYRANDGTANSAPAMVNITVQPVNDPPVARDDSYATEEDRPLVVSVPGVLGNDSDNDADALTAALVAGPSHGTVSLNPNGSFTYTPTLDFNGADSFTYRASDGTAQSGVATVSIAIGGVNDPPVANNDSYSTDEDVTLNISAPGVLANDTDAEGSTLVAVLVTTAAHGTLTLNANGSFIYTPTLNYHGPDAFNYKASDGAKESGVATVSIMVAPLNDPPVANNDSYATDEDTALTISPPGVLANDTDAEGDVLSAALVVGPSHGTLALISNGSFVYTPAANYSGTDSFTYRASDGATSSAPATVSVTVRPVNDAPVAVDDAYATDEDTVLIIPTPGVLSNDTDAEGSVLTAVLVAAPAHGTLSLNPGGSFTYTPDTNFHGGDSFTYKVSDGLADSGVATVSITVRSITEAPVAANDNYSTREDTVLTISAPGVLANDTDGDGDALTAVLVGNPAHGTVALNADGSFLYTPNTDYNGVDSFTYRANDGAFSSAPATVTILITPEPDPRRTADDRYDALEDTVLTIPAPGVLANDRSPDGDPFFAVVVQSPQHGTLTLNGDGGFTYVPEADFNGTDSFLYRAAALAQDSSTSRVDIVIAPVNDRPSFNITPRQVVPFGSRLQALAEWARDIRSGPADEAGQGLSFQLTIEPLTLFEVAPTLSSAGTLTYTLTPGAFGEVTVTVVLKDDGGTANGGVDTSLPRTFTIAINAPPTANIVVPTNGSVFIAPANIAILAEANDIDGVVTNVDLFAGTNRLFSAAAEPYAFTWLDVPAGEYTLRARATDNLGATGDSAPVTISVLERPPILVLGPIALNPQSGLLEQHVRVLNPTSQDYEGVRVLVEDLPADVAVYNRSGLTNGIPYVQHALPVPAGGSVDMTIEYYVPSRVPPSPTLVAELVQPLETREDPAGELVEITRRMRLANGNFMIEWNSLRNRTYFIQYSENLYNWKTVVPPVTGTGTRLQWIDNGPPKTDALPSDRMCRFYRIILAP